MRFSNAFVAAAAVYLLPLASADDASSAASSAASEVAKPAFTPTVLKAPFFEQFTDDWESRWKASTAKKETDKAAGDKEDEEWAYVGTWAAEEPTIYPSIEGDKGLVMKDKAAHHAISAQFPKKVDAKGKDLVVQYEVKLQDGLECGGAYLKLLKDTKNLKQEEFSNASPYVIMFGPDKCGSTNKVHFIFKHKNPKTGEYEEKHMISPPSIVNDKNTNLYTLHVKPDNSFQVRINGESKKNGTLLEDFSPAVEPPAEIDDPKDKKPADWVDEATIADPEAKKPADWDEDAPREIEDDEAEKPADWLDDEPLMVPDPEAEKPEDWDDEEDGDWAPPTVPNPKCAEASGCGEWTRPMKKNPDFKGKWHAPQVENPAYKGVWKPRRISNPEWFKPKDIAAFEPIGALGIELWSMQANILFDNIYIGHSIDDADKLKKETWDVKHAGEEAQQAAETAAQQAENEKFSSTQSGWFEDPVGTLKEKSELFMTVAQRDPVEAIKLVPEVAGAIGVLVATLLALLLGGVGAASSSPQVQAGAQKAKEKATEAKDKAPEAVATGADKAQDATKRATRSTSS